MSRIDRGNAIRTLKGRLRLTGRHLHGSREGMTATDAVVADYKSYRHAKSLFLLGFLVLFVVMVAVDLGVGNYSISFLDVYTILIEKIYGWFAGVLNLIPGVSIATDLGWIAGMPNGQISESVVWDQRMPRILAAIIVGVGLAVAGAAMQSMLKNPLADPYTTGISSGAAFGATIAITLGIYIIPGDAGIIVNAFVFGMIPALVILALSRFRRPSPAMMILAGTSLMYIFNALQQFFMLVTDPNSSQQVLAWTTGSITSVVWSDIPLMLVLVALGMVAIQFLSRTLNAMNSGDAYAKSLGIDVDRFRIIVLLLVSLIAAGIVSFTGIIGFVGLVAPHIARIFIGSDNRYLVPASALLGAVLMLFADVVAHQIVSFDLPIGIVTSVIGGPVFLFLILRQKKEVW
ncbi:MAG: iron ABC transporter permease [Thermoplasmata archaeon]|nr:iron ABC transporter permease [Thermoplasmata archaeon]